MFTFSKDGLDTLVSASSTIAKVNQEVATELATFTKTSIEESVENTKKLMGSGSVTEAVELQSALVKDGIEKAVAETSKVQEMYTKALEEAFGPMAKQFTAPFEKFTKTAA